MAVHSRRSHCSSVPRAKILSRARGGPDTVVRLDQPRPRAARAGGEQRFPGLGLVAPLRVEKDLGTLTSVAPPSMKQPSYVDYYEATYNERSMPRREPGRISHRGRARSAGRVRSATFAGAPGLVDWRVTLRAEDGPHQTVGRAPVSPSTSGDGIVTGAAGPGPFRLSLELCREREFERDPFGFLVVLTGIDQRLQQRVQ